MSGQKMDSPWPSLLFMVVGLGIRQAASSHAGAIRGFLETPVDARIVAFALGLLAVVALVLWARKASKVRFY